MKKKSNKVRKQILSIILVVALVLTQGMIGDNTWVSNATETNLLTNGSFETEVGTGTGQDNSWTMNFNSTYVTAPRQMGDAWLTIPDGSYMQKFWINSAPAEKQTITVEQTLASLDAGVYHLSGKVMAASTGDFNFYTQDASGSLVTTSGWNTWTDVSMDFTLTEATSNYKIGIALNGLSSTTLAIDKLVLTKTADYIPFENFSDSGFEGSIWTDGVWSYWLPAGESWLSSSSGSVGNFLFSNDAWIKADEGLQCIKYWSSVSHKFYFTQVLKNVKAGEYQISVDSMGGSGSQIQVVLGDMTGTLTNTTGYNNWVTATDTFTVAEDCATLTVGVLVTNPANGWGYFDNLKINNKTSADYVIVPDEEPEEVIIPDSDIYVEKIDGLSSDFIRGVDISSYLSEINSNVEFKDWDGNSIDSKGFFTLLKNAGVNYARIRVWNDPYNSDDKGYGGGNNDLTTAITLGKLATDVGMKVLIDFHYSDFWADPGKQKAPKEWANMTLTEKTTAISQYTTDALTAILDAGVNVGMVQVGNETNGKMAGETNFTNVCTLMSSASAAIRAIDAKYDTQNSILIATHFTDPQKNTPSYYAGLLNTNKVDYDVLATSYYPFWHGSLTNLTTELQTIATTYNKKVMVAETSYVYTTEDGDGHENSIQKEDVISAYGATVQGQASAVRDVMKAVSLVGAAGIGVFYWEPAWIPVGNYATAVDKAATLASNKILWETYGSGWASVFAGDYSTDAANYYGGSSWDNQALFDFNGNPLESLNVFKYVYTGTNTPLKVEKVTDCTVTTLLGETVIMPVTTAITYNTGAVSDATVTWVDSEVQNAIKSGVGIYTIHGSITVDGIIYPVSCTLTIKKANLILNASFENTADLTMWKITGAASITKDTSNTKTGDYCLHYYNAAAKTFTLEQVVTGLEPGYYYLSAYTQGGNASSSDRYVLYGKTSAKTYEASTMVTAWKEWKTPEIPEILVTDGTLTVGVEVSFAAGAWGNWDDFYLCKSDKVYKPESTTTTTTTTTTSTTNSSTDVTKNTVDSSASGSAVAETGIPANNNARRTVVLNPVQQQTETEVADNNQDTTEIEEDLVASDDSVADTGEEDQSDMENAIIQDEKTPASDSLKKANSSMNFIIFGIVIIGILAAVTGVTLIRQPKKED